MTDTRDRLRREIEHHRAIAAHAEAIWTWESPAGRHRARRRAALFIERCGLSAGRRALELGCGTGVFLEQVASSGARLHGLDLSADLLQQAHARLRSAPNVRLERGNAEETPYRAGSFDAVYGSSVLHHLNLDRALQETHRVLRPGGRIAFAEPNALNPQVAAMFNVDVLKPRFGVSPDEMAFSRFRARRALRAAGFVDERVVPFDFVHPSLPQRAIGWAASLGRALESTPLLREIAGSLLITARRP